MKFDPRTALAANTDLRKRNPNGLQAFGAVKVDVDAIQKLAVKEPYINLLSGSVVGHPERKEGRSKGELKTPSLSARFLSIWTLLKGPKLIEEVRFHPTRKFRADYAHMPTKTLIEINGSVWVKGGHSSGTGLNRDYNKLNLAQLEGYRLFIFSADMIKEPSKHILPVIDFIRKQEQFLNDMGL